MYHYLNASASQYPTYLRVVQPMIFVGVVHRRIGRGCAAAVMDSTSRDTERMRHTCHRAL